MQSFCRINETSPSVRLYIYACRACVCGCEWAAGKEIMHYSHFYVRDNKTMGGHKRKEISLWRTRAIDGENDTKRAYVTMSIITLLKEYSYFKKAIPQDDIQYE